MVKRYDLYVGDTWVLIMVPPDECVDIKVVFRDVDDENLMNAFRCICWFWNTRGFDVVYRGRFDVFLGRWGIRGWDHDNLPNSGTTTVYMS